MITMVSSAWSVILLLYALYKRDWAGFSAVLLMSLTASMVSGAQHWQPRLPSRKAPRREDSLPPGDVVIRNAKGSFLVVNCPEAVARKLYFNQEDCVYTINDHWSRTLGGAGGGILIIIAVILFSNCHWYVQYGATIAYATLNIFYWLATICPPFWTWDFDDFHLTPSTPVRSVNYTGALAATIRMVGGDVRWVSLSQAAPQSAAWTQWCSRAQEALNTNNDKWFVDRSTDLTAPKKDLSHFQGALTYYLENSPASG